jgi:hypothetical protein
VGYARNILGVELTPAQQEIALAVHQHPYKVKVDSGHNTGKTFIAAVLVNYWYDVFDPGVVITTAPTKRDVEDLLWTEIRLLRRRAKVPLSDDFVGPRSAEMRSGEEHYAKGYTAQKGESFQGRHRPRMFFVFDEDEGVDPVYWTTAKTMFKGELGNAWLAIGNPTTTTSQGYLESVAADRAGNPSWRLIRMSALDHPNIALQLEGKPPRIPDAVTLSQIESWIAEWCEPIPAEERQATDFEWPPKSGNWYRPGPIGQSRILGLRPDQGTYGVWSEALWQMAMSGPTSWRPGDIPEIGCDVARYGNDWTEIHVRWGPVSVLHEAYNGWSTVRTAKRLIELVNEWAARASRMLQHGARPVDPKAVPIKVDDDGVGGAVLDILWNEHYSGVAVNAASLPARPDDYPNKRSELWFSTREKARQGVLNLSRLPREVLDKLKVQAMAPVWKLDAEGRRVVEPKPETKKKIGRSPDGMHALNMAFYEGSTGFPVPVINVERRPLTPEARGSVEPYQPPQPERVYKPGENPEPVFKSHKPIEGYADDGPLMDDGYGNHFGGSRRRRLYREY